MNNIKKAIHISVTYDDGSTVELDGQRATGISRQLSQLLGYALIDKYIEENDYSEEYKKDFYRRALFPVFQPM